MSILSEMVDFDNDPAQAQTMMVHLKRSFHYIAEHKGPHQLPLIGRADWNDCLNLNCFSAEPGESFQTVTNNDTGIAESVFIAGMYVGRSGRLRQPVRSDGRDGRSRLCPCGKGGHDRSGREKRLGRRVVPAGL